MCFFTFCGTSRNRPLTLSGADRFNELGVFPPSHNDDEISQRCSAPVPATDMILCRREIVDRVLAAHFLLLAFPILFSMNN